MAGGSGLLGLRSTSFMALLFVGLVTMFEIMKVWEFGAKTNKGQLVNGGLLWGLDAIRNQGDEGVSGGIISARDSLPNDTRAAGESRGSSDEGHGGGGERPAAPPVRRIAIIYTGHVRAFVRPEVRQSHLRNLIEPIRKLGFEPYIFFSTAAGDAFRERKLFESVAPEDVERWVRDEFNITNFGMRVNAPLSVPRPDRGRCRSRDRDMHLTDIDRFFMSWHKVREGFRLAAEFEESERQRNARSGFRFEFMMRMRPDLLFLKPGEFAGALGAAAPETGADAGEKSEGLGVLWTPPAKYIFARQINDWVVLCRRRDCKWYFEMITEWEACAATVEANSTRGPPPPFKRTFGKGNASAPAQMCCHAWAPFYDTVLHKHELVVKESELAFPVVPTRVESVDCNRLAATPRLVEVPRVGYAMLQGEYGFSQSRRLHGMLLYLICTGLL